MANALVKELRNIPRINPYQCYLNVLLFWHLLRKIKERWVKETDGVRSPLTSMGKLGRPQSIQARDIEVHSS